MSSTNTPQTTSAPTKPKMTVLPAKPVVRFPTQGGDITVTHGSGEGDVTVVFKMVMTPEEISAQLVGSPCVGLPHGLVGGTQVVFPTTRSVEGGDTCAPTNSVCAYLLRTFVDDVVKPEVTRLNPDLAERRRVAELEAKAKAYDELMAKLAIEEKAKKEAQAIKTAKMVATKAKLKSETSSVASTEAERGGAKVVKAKKVAPPLKPEETA